MSNNKTSSNFASHSVSVEFAAEMQEKIAAFEAKQAEQEATIAKSIETAVAAAIASKVKVKSEAATQDYSGFSEGSAALIKACGQRTRNDRARLTALVYDAKRISIPDICAKIKFVSDRHGNLTDAVFNRADVMRVLRRVQADLLQSAQMYNLYIDTRVVDKVEYLQLFDRTMRPVEDTTDAPVSEPESKVS